MARNKMTLAALAAALMLSTVGTTGALWHVKTDEGATFKIARYEISQEFAGGYPSDPVYLDNNSSLYTAIPEQAQADFAKDGTVDIPMTFTFKRWGNIRTYAGVSFEIPKGVKVSTYYNIGCTGEPNSTDEWYASAEVGTDNNNTTIHDDGLKETRGLCFRLTSTVTGGGEDQSGASQSTTVKAATPDLSTVKIETYGGGYTLSPTCRAE